MLQKHSCCPPCSLTPNASISVQVSRIALLFSRADVTALSWLHLALMDAFAVTLQIQRPLCFCNSADHMSLLSCREVFLDGLRHNVFTSHSVLLCFMFGPTGLLSHWLTIRIMQS